MSDLHLEFAEFTPTPVASTLLLAGDILTWKTYRNNKSKRKRYDAFLRHVSDEWDNVVAIGGNHEYYGWNGDVHRHLRDLYNSYGIHYLENDMVTINGLRIAGAVLWTDFFGNQPYYKDTVRQGMNDYHVTSLTPDHTYDMHQRTRAYLQKVRPDIVVTHHAPSVESVHPNFLGSALNAGYYSVMDDFVTELNPMYWVHGHMHHVSEYYIDTTKVVCNPRGYPNENNNFDETRVLWK